MKKYWMILAVFISMSLNCAEEVKPKISKKGHLEYVDTQKGRLTRFVAPSGMISYTLDNVIIEKDVLGNYCGVNKTTGETGSGLSFSVTRGIQSSEAREKFDEFDQIFNSSQI